VKKKKYERIARTYGGTKLANSNPRGEGKEYWEVREDKRARELNYIVAPGVN